MTKKLPKVDIIIPVYNNFDLTKQCIISLYKNLKHHINKLIIHDDCSDNYTQHELIKLKHHIFPNIELHRSESNIGFAAGVNKGCSFATANYLFILNSDTQVLADIISPMLEILENTPNLAAINPSGEVFKLKKLNRFLEFPCDHNENLTYIKSANISGYALLIRTSIFNSLGGFNTIYGRGYYEDTELSRILIDQGYELAIYKTEDITHLGQSSFKTIKSKTNNFAKELINKNKQLYLQRHPSAEQKLNIATFTSDFNKLPIQLQGKIISTVLDGGTVTINGVHNIKNLPIYPIRFNQMSFAELIKLLLHKNISLTTA